MERSGLIHGSFWPTRVHTPNGISTGSAVFGRPFVKRFALCYRTIVCLSCDSCPVCDVGVLWPNRLTDQDETWQAGRPRLWPHCVRWGPSIPSLKGAQPPIFGPYPLQPNGYTDQDATGMEVGLGPGDFVLDGDPARPLNFWPMFIIVIVISLEHCTGVRRYWFVQVQVMF